MKEPATHVKGETAVKSAPKAVVRVVSVVAAWGRTGVVSWGGN